MSGSDVALIVAAFCGAGGVITAMGNVILQIMTLRQTQANSEKLDVSNKKLDANTSLTEDAKYAAARAVSAASTAATNSAAVMANVAATLETVRSATDGQTDKLVASALAQGMAEGHQAGVQAEQTRVAGMTQQLKTLG